MKDARIYVGTYRKYNNGSLEGKWLTVGDYIDYDSFMEECVAVHANEAVRGERSVCPKCGSRLTYKKDESIFYCLNKECDGEVELGEIKHDIEFMYQDHDKELGELVTESSIDKRLWDIIDALDKNDVSDIDAFIIFMNYKIYELSHLEGSELVDKFIESYVGEADSVSDVETWYGNYIVESNQIVVPEHLLPYIDFESIGREYLFGSAWSSGRHVFSH